MSGGMSKGLLVEECRRRIMRGDVNMSDPHLARQLVIEHFAENDFAVFICDERGRRLVEVCRVHVRVGESGTIMEIDKAFDITCS